MESTEGTIRQWNIPEGTEIRSVDDEKLGKAVAVQPDYIVVEKGFFFPTDYYIPTTAVTNYDGDKAYLGLTKDEVLHQGWDREPTAYAAYSDATAAGAERLVEAAPTGTAERYAEGETIRVPVHEEELAATKRTVERGQVRIEKDVVAEERTLDVPVTEERVTVTRRAVDREGVADDTAFTEGTLEVPVRGEEVDLEKRVRVAEEVEIGKEAVQRTERVGGTVRREEVRVDDAGLATGRGSQQMAWAPTAYADYDVLTGKDVHSAEGDKVGTIKRAFRPSGDFAAGVGRHYFLLDPGALRDWFGGYDEVYLPESAITGVSDDRVTVSYTKDQIKNAGWTTRPADLDSYR